MASVAARTFTLGRYTCVERLGSGPVGEAWRAKRFGLVGVERQVYIHKLAPVLSKDAGAQGRLAGALKAYAELERDGVLRLIESTTAAIDAFVVCEFPGFADLRKLRSGFESIVDRDRERDRAHAQWIGIVLFLGRSLTGLLSTAQTSGLWHGLLSPASIWMCPDGSIRVSELGLAALLPTVVWTQDASIKALASYLPPEVLSGASPAGPENDLFSVGAILAELLTQAPGGPSPLGTALREIADRARTTSRSQRFASMAELAKALDSLPDAEVSPDSVRQTLGRIAEQFLLAGDTVPQPVTISERSSAEPLPPPPGKSGDPKVSARMRLSAPGETSGQAVGRDISKPDAPSAAGKKADAVPRGESEDTPLPQSRPLLLTNPKISASPGASTSSSDGAVSGPVPTKQSGPQAQVSAKNSQPPRAKSKEPGKHRSGIDWLTSSGDSMSTEPPAVAEQEAKAAPAPKTTSVPPRGAAAVQTSGAAKDSGRTAQVGRGSSNPPASGPAGAKRRSNPVSVNPKARVAASPAASASTPTADQPVGQALDTVLPAKADGAEAWGHAPNTLSLNETNPALAPVKVSVAKPPAVPEAKPADSAELLAKAAAALSQGPAVLEPSGIIVEPEPSESKRRSGPISEPQPRVLTSTAPAEIVAVNGAAPTASATGEPAVSPAPATLDNTPPIPGDVAIESPPAPSGRRTVMLAVLGSLLLAGVFIVYKLVSGPPTGQTGASDASAETSDAGATTGSGKSQEAAATDVVVNSSPAGRVFFDGVDKGKSPQTIKWPGGSHKLVVVAEGHKILRREVTAAGTLDLKLDPARLPEDIQGAAQIKVTCKTDGKLRIFVDGHDSGLACPAEDLSISPGKHTLTFVDPAASSTDKPKEKKIKAKKGKKPTKVKVKF